ncbi:Rho termination factor [Argonema galeatum]|uniref:Rho termination factor n=1 Tax=Argonema galeatum TaxID=2942762 RepID=UPI002012F5DD|nr:Rho termination factor [Argonema galeatum]MCL1464202.1 Rho termination factor [Argonema galeatum A003/A1]
MGKFDDIGKLMHLPLDSIQSEGQSSELEFIINAAAEAVLQAGGRNWVPVIVKENGDYQYKVVSNHFIYAVAQKAELDRVWCIVIEPDDQSIKQAKILAREVTPKVNLTTASRDTILAALRYLIAEPGSALKGADVMVAANRIAAADRETWSSFNPITTLKCGITKGKKLDAIAKVFFLSAPKPSTPPPPAPEVISIKRASREDFLSRLSYLSNYKIGGFETVDPENAADAIFTASKGKWKSLNPISKLECGIDTAKIKTLKTVFSL